MDKSCLFNGSAQEYSEKGAVSHEEIGPTSTPFGGYKNCLLLHENKTTNK